MALSNKELAAVIESLQTVLDVRPLLQEQSNMLTHALNVLANIHPQDIDLMLSQYATLLRRTVINTKEGSQHEEDAILRELLPDDPITYIEIGAAYPVLINNTWQFYQHGGRGLLIEPVPYYWYKLLTHRPGDFLWPAGVSDHVGHARMSVCYECSSIDPDWPIEKGTDVLVEVSPLPDILDRFPTIRDNPIHLCTLDVEGHERQVLRGIDWKQFRPDVFMVEYAKWVPDLVSVEDLSKEWAHLLTDHGYQEKARTPLNIIYVREDSKPYKKGQGKQQ